MSSLQTLNNNYYDLLKNYVDLKEKYHKLEQRITACEKANKFDLDQKILKICNEFFKEQKAKSPAPKTTGKTKTKK
tara:strand:- start:1256 stop:1483 length:228 start_codon:yes stop_codon:yes gene_type:complete